MTLTDFVIALARCLNIAGLATLAGMLFFGLALYPKLAEKQSRELGFYRDWLRLCIFSLALASAGLLIWIPLQTAALIGTNNPLEIARALPLVLSGTAFGIAISLRVLIFIIIVLLFPAARRKWSSSLLLVLVFCALLLQLRMGHPAAAEDIGLPLAVGAHIIAAALWFGSLPPLYVLLRRSQTDGLRVARRFSIFGLLFVSVLFCGAIAAAWFLAGGLPGLVGTLYGNIILAKSLIFILMLTIAALNRFYLSRPGASGRGLQYALIVEGGLGLVAFIAASLLATQPPGIHEDIFWPFAYRLRDNIFSDAFLMDMVWRSVKPFALAALIIACGVAFPRWRWVALGAGIAAALMFAQPLRLNLFLEDATPASFLRSPTGYSTIAIARGETAFQTHCSSCHGEDGRGRGPLATGDPAWPPDLTAPFFASRSDGELYWTTLKGRKTASGIASMPGFEDQLDSKTAWSLVDYIRTIGSARSIGLPSPNGEVPPVRAPQVQLSCNNTRYDLGQPSTAFMLVTIEADNFRTERVDDAGNRDRCAVSDQTAYAAYALLIHNQNNTRLLIDGDGWIRFRWSMERSDQELAAAIQKARDKPVTSLKGGHHL